MKLIDAIKIQEEFEKDNSDKQYLIISNSYNVAFISPVYDVVDNKLVISRFIDVNLCFHNIHEEMSKIDDWEIAEVNSTILNSVTKSNNKVSFNNEYYDFNIINMGALYKSE